MNKTQRKNKLKRVKVYNALKKGHGVSTGLREPSTLIAMDGAPDETKAKVQRHLERTGQIRTGRSSVGRMPLSEMFPELKDMQDSALTAEEAQEVYRVNHMEPTDSELAAAAAAIQRPQQATTFAVRINGKRGKSHAVVNEGTVAVCGKDVGDFDPTLVPLWIAADDRCKHCESKLEGL